MPDELDKVPVQSLVEVQRGELEDRIAGLDRKQRRHLVWLVLGISPGAVLPALGLMREGSVGLLLILLLLVFLTQFYSWVKTGRQIRDLREEIELLEEGD